MRSNTRVVFQDKYAMNNLALFEVSPLQICRYYGALHFLLAFFVPTVILMHVCDTEWHLAMAFNYLRIVVIQHYVYLINSSGHNFGTKPYNKQIAPTDSASLNAALLGDGKIWGLSA